MSFLLRTESDYRVFYGEPKSKFIITSSGSYFCADEYQKMVDEEKEIAIHSLMEDDNVPYYGWADVCQNNRGIVIAEDIAEYLLDGDELNVNSWIELATIKTKVT